jgi:hypothetical protein
MNIPIVIICYNNYRYVANTLVQIAKINKDYYANIIILNNASTCPETIAYLKSVGVSGVGGVSGVSVINNVGNLGPWITHMNNRHIYDLLPDKYIITDPDLKLNEKIPCNFIEILANLSDTYKTSKIGFALDISDYEQFHTTKEYMANQTIREWEAQFWKKKIDNSSDAAYAAYELYDADIDTTFCLMNKTNIMRGYDNKIRVAGDFTAKHIPWYIENEVYNLYDSYILNTNTTHISTISRIVKPYVENNYLRVHKNDEYFWISKRNNNPFWKDIYGDWKKEMFEVFDRYLSKDKVFIDIGTWITPTAMYGSRKSKHIYAITTDTEIAEFATKDMKENCEKNYTFLDYATTNIETLLADVSLLADAADASLINVDIGGEEENRLDELYDICVRHDIPLYICFHYHIWKDKNLDRFHYLTEDDKNNIIATTATTATTSILLNSKGVA